MFESTAIITRRPPCALVLELYSIGLEGGTRSTARSTEMNCAEMARRGLPSTVSVKSPAAWSGTGRQLLSMTLTSTGTRSNGRLEPGLGRRLVLRREQAPVPALRQMPSSGGLHPLKCYRWRSATLGSTPAARWAGK
jgi:hypothetical protein